MSETIHFVTINGVNKPLVRWTEETGKGYDTALAHKKRKEKGLDITWEQVVGLEEYEYVAPKRQRKKTNKDRQKAVISDFFRKALVPQ